jgi:hypothetical protein
MIRQACEMRLRQVCSSFLKNTYNTIIIIIWSVRPAKRVSARCAPFFAPAHTNVYASEHSRTHKHVQLKTNARTHALIPFRINRPTPYVCVPLAVHARVRVCGCYMRLRLFVWYMYIILYIIYYIIHTHTHTHTHTKHT